MYDLDDNGTVLPSVLILLGSWTPKQSFMQNHGPDSPCTCMKVPDSAWSDLVAWKCSIPWLTCLIDPYQRQSLWVTGRCQATQSFDLWEGPPAYGEVWVYNVWMDAAVLGDRLPEGTQKPLLGPGTPPFAVLRELESACRVGIFWDAVTVPTVCFSGVLRGSPEGSSSLRPKPSASICSIFEWGTSAVKSGELLGTSGLLLKPVVREVLWRHAKLVSNLIRDQRLVWSLPKTSLNDLDLVFVNLGFTCRNSPQKVHPNFAQQLGKTSSWEYLFWPQFKARKVAERELP